MSQIVTPPNAVTLSDGSVATPNVTIQTSDDGPSLIVTPGSGGGYASSKGSVLALGAEGNDTLSGADSSGPVTIYGFGGNEVISGSRFNGDLLLGNQGNDTISGGDGIDLMAGGLGNDLLYGGQGDDTVFGDAGNDTLEGGDGNDALAGGDGDDQVNGAEGNDVIWGQQGSDSLYGGNGNDTIYGGKDNDVIAGGDGNDYITGDLGNDNLSGNAGSDVFAFSSFGASNADVVVDFVSGVDKIRVQGAGSGVTLVPNFNSASPGANTGLVYDSTNGKLYFITGGAAQEVATFVGNPGLTANDFELF